MNALFAEALRRYVARHLRRNASRPTKHCSRRREAKWRSKCARDWRGVDRLQHDMHDRHAWSQKPDPLAGIVARARLDEYASPAYFEWAMRSCVVTRIR